MNYTHNVASLTLSLDSGTPYASGDVLADTQEVSSVFLSNGGRATLQNIVVLDKDDQAGAFDVVFMDANKSLGTENSAVSITDSNAESVVAVVSVSTSDYSDFVNSRIACKDNIDTVIEAASTSTSLWVGAVSRDTKTYTTNGIVLKMGFKRMS